MGRFISSLHQSKLAPSVNQSERNFFFSCQSDMKGPEGGQTFVGTRNGLASAEHVSITVLLASAQKQPMRGLFGAPKWNLCRVFIRFQVSSTLLVMGFELVRLSSQSDPKSSAPPPGVSSCVPVSDVKGQKTYMEE